MKITTIQEARDLDITVNRCIRDGYTLEQIIVELVNERLERDRIAFMNELNAAGGPFITRPAYDPFKNMTP